MRQQVNPLVMQQNCKVATWASTEKRSSARSGVMIEKSLE